MDFEDKRCNVVTKKATCSFREFWAIGTWWTNVNGTYGRHTANL